MRLLRLPLLPLLPLIRLLLLALLAQSAGCVLSADESSDEALSVTNVLDRRPRAGP
jgi:hypothetical protein